MPLCTMENVIKQFYMGGKVIEVLRGISLEIEQGEFVAIIGASGSGKTTLMNLIGCLDVVSSGRYVFAGRDVSHLTDDELSLIRNEHIGFVFQNFYLIPYATVFENVLLPTLYAAVHKDHAEERALELLRLVGLGERAKFKPNRLSGGEQQRVAIARALINDPELILADEPTGQLDSSTAGEIMNMLSKMHERGKTVAVVTHDMNIAGYAQRIIRIKDGLIQEQSRRTGWAR